MCLTPAVRGVHFGIEAFRWCIAVEGTLPAVHEMLCIGGLPHQPSDAFDDVSTPECDRALVCVIPSHILESVKFLLPMSLILRYGSHVLVDDIPVYECLETPSVVFCLQHVVVVRLYDCLLNPTRDTFVLFTGRK